MSYPVLVQLDAVPSGYSGPLSLLLQLQSEDLWVKKIRPLIFLNPGIVCAIHLTSSHLITDDKNLNFFVILQYDFVSHCIASHRMASYRHFVRLQDSHQLRIYSYYPYKGISNLTVSAIIIIRPLTYASILMSSRI